MIEPEIQKYLSGFNQHLVDLKAKKTPGIWRSFFNGMFSAFGYIVGLVIAVVVLGWALNKAGLVAPIQEQWQKFQSFMSQAQNLMNSTQPDKGNEQGSIQKGQIYTLPNGQKVQLVQ